VLGRHRGRFGYKNYALFWSFWDRVYGTYVTFFLLSSNVILPEHCLFMHILVPTKMTKSTRDCIYARRYIDSEEEYAREMAQRKIPMKTGVIVKEMMGYSDL
jgi:hypothetical protein